MSNFYMWFYTFLAVYAVSAAIGIRLTKKTLDEIRKTNWMFDDGKEIILFVLSLIPILNTLITLRLLYEEWESWRIRRKERKRKRRLYRQAAMLLKPVSRNLRERGALQEADNLDNIIKLLMDGKVES